MGYLQEFQKRVHSKDSERTLHLWDEYLTCDKVDAPELIQILNLIKRSEIKQAFGPKAETAIPLWEMVQDQGKKDEIIKLIFDLQNTNSPQIKELGWKLIEEKYGSHPNFREWQRISGIRTGVPEDFQGILRKFELLNHMGKGKFVFHTGGWGTGEIMDISFIRQQLQIEFENVGGIKELSFANAFKVLDILPESHFLARRFSEPDRFEEEARKDPLGTIKLLLKDLGPKTSQQIKDELMDLVIPEADWVKWWQGVRARLKKDPLIETPGENDDTFFLREKAKSLSDHLEEALAHQEEMHQFIPALYAMIRDVPDALKDPQTSAKIEEVLKSLLKGSESYDAKLQLALFLEQYFNQSLEGSSVKDLIQRMEYPERVIDAIGVLALKKRILEAIRKERPDWAALFLRLFSTPQPAVVRDYLLKELLQHAKGAIDEKLSSLLREPQKDPETFVWYFQKILHDEEIPYATKEGRGAFLESLLTLLSAIENDPEHKELIKRIYNLLVAERYKVVRQLIEGMPKSFLSEFLLLSSKCHTISHHDQKVFHSLAAVVDPSFSTKEVVDDRLNPHIFWITQESLQKAQEKIKHIGTVEIVEVAREIEAARALGDLRENSEYKFAQEKRRRLQGELKTLSEQIQKARLITEEDVNSEEVGVGNIVDLVDAQGNKISYTILGPFDADPERHVLSTQSQIALTLLGKSVGDSVTLKNEEHKITHIGSIFKK